MKIDGEESELINNIKMLEATTNKCRTRMKKVAPPPPPPGGVPSDQRPPLTNGDIRRQTSHEAPPVNHHHHNHHPGMTSTPGEDCAFDELLEGRMELEVVLPDNKTVHMIVDRRTPMMDLLVHAATANKISPGGHVIRVVSKGPRESQQLQQEEELNLYQRDVPYKPNTPVGSLDVNTVHIIPKPPLDIPVRRMPKLANQPFEQQTFRLQVNLPRNQRMVLRVSPRITLAELKRQICNEKELDHSSHHLVHPAQPDTVLDLNSTLEIYGCAEISLMSNSGLRDSIRSTSTHLIGYPRIEDEKKKKGILRLFSKKKRETTETNTNGINSRGVSPTRNMSTSSNRDSYQPKQSTKRKPAPAPPPPISQTQPPPSPPLVIQSSSSINSRPESEISAKTDELGSTVSHSRHSSDSSGYHEPSVFSDCSQENKSPEASIVQGGGGGGITTNVVLCTTCPTQIVPPDSLPLVSRQTTPVKEPQQCTSVTNLKTVPCCSSTSIVSATRKRKAPQPPAPPVLQEVETPSSPEDTSPLATIKPITENTTPEELIPSTEDLNTEPIIAEETLEIPAKEFPVDSSLETTSEEKEAITYLENVLEESESISTKSPTPLSSEQDNSDDVDSEIITTSETNTSINNVQESGAVQQQSSAVQESVNECDTSVIERNVDVEPSAATHSLDLCADDLNSFPEANTSNEDDAIEISHDFKSTKSGSVLNGDIPVVNGYLSSEDEYPCTETDTSELPTVPSNTNILPETTSESPVETSIQLNFEVSNFVSDFKETEQQNQKEAVCSNSNPVSENNFKPEIVQNLPQEETPTNIEPIKDEDNQNLNKEETIETDLVNSSDQYIPKMNVDSPKSQRKLVNFALGCYKNEQKDIYEDTQQEVPFQIQEDTKSVIKNGKTQTELSKTDSLPKCKREAPTVKIVPFEERSAKPVPTNSKDQVQQRCTQLSKISTLPLTGRSSSLYNLVQQSKPPRNRPVPMESLPEGLKRTQSDQNLTQDVPDAEEKQNFIQEQKRLHEEYLKLQAQFISWQKQLLNNQSLLQNEQIVSKFTFPDLEKYKLQLENLPDMLKLNATQTSENSQTENLTKSSQNQKSPSSDNSEKSSPIRQISDVETLLVKTDPSFNNQLKAPKALNSSTETENTVIYAQVNKQRKTSKSNVINSDVNTPDTCNNPVTPELPIKQQQQPVTETNSKSQTLPRPKTESISAFDTSSRTMTLNRQSRPKAQAVAVTIGSWQQRNQAMSNIDSASVASSRSMFQSLENIPREFPKSVTSVNAPKESFKPITSVNTPKEPPKPAVSTSTEVKTIPTSPTNSNIQPAVVTAKVIVKRDGKEIIEDQTRDTKPLVIHNSKPRNDSIHQRTVPKSIEARKQSTKSETKPENHTSHNKPTKPLVLLSSMKDESRPPSIQVLKKWPLSEMNEKESPQKTERSIWNELKASAKLPSGSAKEKVTRAEVDLRKHRSQKDRSKSPKDKETEPSTSKLHVSKVNINIENKKSSSSSSETNSKSATLSNSMAEKQRKSFPISKSESFNAELKDVLFKRASSMVEHDSDPTESNYAELNGGNGVHTEVKTVTVNGNSPPPPPPPPVSTMPTIPPAAPIPKSSQLLMGKRTKDTETKVKSSRSTSNKQPKLSPKKDPREELMLEIRGFGGRQALRKKPATPTGWNLKVYGSATLKS